MTSFSPLMVVAVALVDGDGRVLLQQRPPGKPMAGLWEFPGGKVEPGEPPEAALVREPHATALAWKRPAQMYALDMPPADLPLIGLLDALL